MTLADLLSWASDKDHRDIVAWGGGGLTVCIGAAWAVFKFAAERKDKKHSAPSAISISGGVNYASGPGATYHGPITINPDPAAVAAPLAEELKRLTASQKDLAAQIAQENC